MGGTGKPLFVIATNTKDNIIYTGLGEDHPGLLRHGLFVKKEDIHWIRPDKTLNVGIQLPMLQEFGTGNRYLRPPY